MGRPYNKRREFLAEMGPHTGGTPGGKVSRGVKEVLSRTEEKERHKDSGGSDSEEVAQGNILHVEQKRELQI